SDAASSPTSISLGGSGVQAALSVSPASIDFGNVNNGTSKSQTVTLKNTGTASLTISAATMSGAGFTTTGLTAPLTLTAGQSSTFSIVFAPTSGTTFTGTLSLTNNAPGSPATVSLTGAGAQSAISVSPTSLSFGSVMTSASSSKTVTITNSGNAALT